MSIETARMYQRPSTGALPIEKLWLIVVRYQHCNLESAAREFWRRPPQNIQIRVEASIFEANKRNFPSLGHLISFLDRDDVLMR